MRRSESASKRVREATESPPAELASPFKRQELQADFRLHASAPVSRDQSPTPSRASKESQAPEEFEKIAEMPAFLNQTPEELTAKYADLTSLENARISASQPSSSRQVPFSSSPLEGASNPWARIQPSQTKGRDRFNDIFVWASNRISLVVPEGHSDYINASPITMSSHRTGKTSKYIAMQAPKRETVGHVWRMVWSEVETPGVVVMLSQDDHFPYFPQNPSEATQVNEGDEFEDGFHGTLTCEALETSDDGATEIRKLVMKVRGEEEEKIFYHLLYVKWPDYGIPLAASNASLLNLIALSRKLNKDPKNPRIVHCRAGVGRSGTFIALDFLLSDLLGGGFKASTPSTPTSSNFLSAEGPSSGTGRPAAPGSGRGLRERRMEEEDPIFDTVNSLRMQRRLSVQTVGQYAFLYEMVKDAWEEQYGMKIPVRTPGANRPGSSRQGSFGGTRLLRLSDVEDVFRD